jgi:hypothetical protein
MLDNKAFINMLLIQEIALYRVLVVMSLWSRNPWQNINQSNESIDDQACPEPTKSSE